ncbi:hypothetical protein [Luteimonas saliphila]|uniref:hypothetical protein n=1 Tax=Luteimonas saliphila TaxID=2804919 RepID=UPI00192DDB37|nr:hypothetical protein [Luteimonas saliphila]
MTADSRFALESASIATVIALPVAIGFAIASDGDVLDWNMTWAGLVLAAAVAAACAARLSTRRDLGTSPRARPLVMALRVVAVAYLLFLGMALVLAVLDQSLQGSLPAAGLRVVAPRPDNVGFVMAYVGVVSLGVGLVPALLLEYVACRRYLQRPAGPAASRA